MSEEVLLSMTTKKGPNIFIIVELDEIMFNSKSSSWWFWTKPDLTLLVVQWQLKQEINYRDLYRWTTAF